MHVTARPSDVKSVVDERREAPTSDLGGREDARAMSCDAFGPN
jgi:hypothetical protein